MSQLPYHLPFLPACDTRRSSNLCMKLFRSSWGNDCVFDPSFWSVERAHPYAGIEAGLVFMSDAQKHSLNALRQIGVEFVAMIFTDLPWSVSLDVASHVRAFTCSFHESLAYTPHHINVHAGRDSWNTKQQHEFFHEIFKVIAQHDTPVYFETHRGRILYNPWTTCDLLQAFPQLNLTLDISHFTCVLSRTMSFHSAEDHDALSLIVKRARHVHARVGYEDGPQVPDPRAPEWKAMLLAHEAVWRAVFDDAEGQQRQVVTVTPEYGPPTYMHTLPFTNQPVADLVAVTDWAAARLQRLFMKQVDEEK